MKNSGKTSRAEFRAILVIGILLVLSITLPSLYDKLFPKLTKSTAPFIASYTLHKQDSTHYNISKRNERPAQRKKNFFAPKDHKRWSDDGPHPKDAGLSKRKAIRCTSFDPNSVTEETLLEMGIQKYVANNLIRYRASGAIFRTPDDVRKVYGIDSTLFSQLQNCIRIELMTSIAAKSADQISVEINKAGIDEWTALPGIGNVLAARIIKYRDHLGGFHSIEQIGETYGLPTETLEAIRNRLILTEAPRKLDLNTAEIEELAAHPYITQRQAEAIVNFRTHHGAFAAPDQVLKIYSLDAEWYAHIQPYLWCSGMSEQSQEIATR